MSKFRFTLDENGNVSNISFPKTKIEAKIEYPKTAEGDTITPSGVSINGQSMTVDQFSEIKVEKDEGGNITIGGGSGSGGHPWWWDIFDKFKGETDHPTSKQIIEEPVKEVTTNDYKRNIDS